MDKKTFIIITLGLIIALSLSVKIKADGAARRMDDICSDYYKVIEKEYVAGVRQKLDDRGFEYAGITMTKVVDIDGVFQYTVSIHHRRIDKMNAYERQQLSDIITVDKVAVEGSSIEVRYR